jgi:AcrR family transcriptional regulator
MPELELTRIVQAALGIAARAGPDGLTMRALADELGVTPPALYHHVEDKKALISLMVDAVVTEHELPAPTGDWREDLWRMARAMREMSLAHPAVSELRRGHQIWTPAVLPLTERWMSLWIQSGLPLEEALRAAITTSLSITGIVDGELLLRGMKRPEPTALTWVPNARLAFATERDADADFELVVRALIDGVHARLGSTKGRATA